MDNNNKITNEYQSFAIDFPPEVSEEEIFKHKERFNLILKTPVIVNFTNTEEFYLHFANHLKEVVPAIRDVIFFTYEDEFDRYIPKIYGELDNDRIEVPVEKLINMKAVEEVRKPVLFKKGVFDKVDSMLEILNTEQLIIYPIYVEGTFRGLMGCTCIHGEKLEVEDVKILWNLSFYLELFNRICESSKSLIYYAFYDPLTSLFNRRVFSERLEQEMLKSRRTGRHFTLLVADIDNFKDYNDRFHHAAGDISLQEVSDIIRDSVREIDTVARLGGDEFGIILSGTGSTESLIVAERILSRVSAHLFPDDNFEKTQRLTLSIGGAVFPQDAFSIQELARKADEALFLAKKLGGNRMIRSEDAFLMKLGTGPIIHDIQPQNLYEAVRTVFNFEKFMELLLHISLDALQAERGSLFVREGEKEDFILLAKRGFSTNGNEKQKKIYGGRIIKEVAVKKKPFLSDDGLDEEMKKNLMREGFYNESFISIPLVKGDVAIGVLNISNKKEGGRFTREDVETITPLLNRVTEILEEGINFRKNLKSFGEMALTAVSEAFEMKYPFYIRHSEDVAELSVRIARVMGLNGSKEETIRLAGRLHDVGMVCIPASIMNKKTALVEGEYQVVKKHPFVGWKILENYPEFEEVRSLILSHHERFDGMGYPFGLKGADIPVEASIISLAEFFTSIISPRPHRKSYSRDEAIEMVRRQRGKGFDPKVVDAFLKISHQ